MTKSTLSLTLFIGVVIFACKKKPIETTETFNKSTLLVSVTDGIIVPRYQTLQNEIGELSAAWADFKISQDQQNLNIVQEKWLDANIKFQRAKVFNFGPAMDNGLNASFGTYPTDTSKILTNATITSPNLGAIANIDAIGFPALEFLLYRTNALSLLTSDPNLTQYVDLVIDKMETEINQVVNSWTSSYSAIFKNGSGTEVTSGFSLLVNAFNKDFELAKNAKLGIPIGVQSLGIPQMEYEEAPFANQSLRLLTENLIGIRNLYDGVHENGSNDVGFDDYLVTLEKNHTHTQISDRFNFAFLKLSSLDDDLEYEVQNHMPDLNELYTNLQALVVHLKTDMTSAFGVLITYQDNDGD